MEAYVGRGGKKGSKELQNVGRKKQQKKKKGRATMEKQAGGACRGLKASEAMQWAQTKVVREEELGERRGGREQEADGRYEADIGRGPETAQEIEMFPTGWPESGTSPALAAFIPPPKIMFCLPAMSPW